MPSVLELGLGLGLAGAAGIRTYLPLIVIGLLTRFSVTLHYRAPFKVFASVPVLLIFLILAGYELLIDNNHEFKTREAVILSAIRAMGGAVLLAGLFGGFGTLVGLILGGITALVIHLIKIRLTVHAARQKHINQVWAGIDDFAALAGIMLTILVPWSSYIILAGIIVVYIRNKQNNNRYRPDSKARSWR